MYYALPVMKGVLPPAYFNHLCILVSALHILTSDYIPRAKLVEAEQVLKLFYTNFQSYMVMIINTMACIYVHYWVCVCLTTIGLYVTVNFLLQGIMW